MKWSQRDIEEFRIKAVLKISYKQFLVFLSRQYFFEN